MPTAAEVRERWLVHDLREALSRGDRLSMHYMPTVELKSSTMVGLEALVRWDHPELGAVPPADFVALAERNGMAAALGDHVRDLVLTDLNSGRLPTWSVAVNVSGVELGDTGFSDRVLDMCEQHGADPARLTVEVTETAIARDLGHAAEALRRLRAAGFQIAIDDFGTGHASLEYLASLPCDVVKIDRRFTSGLDTDERCVAIVQGVIGMSHALGLTVVAEGVETPAQRDRLVELGCEEAQGDLFGRPVPIEALPAPGAILGRGSRPAREQGPRHRPAEASAQVLLDLALDLQQCNRMEDAFRRTLEAVRPHLLFTGGSVQLVGPDGIRLAAAHPPPTDEALAARLPTGQGVGWTIVTSRRVRYIPDITAPAVAVPSRRRRTSTTRHTRSYVGVPLIVAGSAIGLVQVDSVDVDAFTEADQLLLAGCTCVLAAAMAARGLVPDWIVQVD